MPRPSLLTGLALVLLLSVAMTPSAKEARAADYDYVLQIDMYGEQQVPAVKSVGYGFVRFFFSADRTFADYTVDVKGFGAPSVLGADIHRGRPGENGPVIKHLADGDFIVTAGELHLTPAELAEMESGNWYVSLKTKDNPRGEFRGQITLPPDFFPGSEATAEADDVATEWPAEEPAADTAAWYYYYDGAWQAYEALTYSYYVSPVLDENGQWVVPYTYEGSFAAQ